MAADDLWAQMQAEESRYAASNRHRVAKTSLASLATQVKPKAAKAKPQAAPKAAFFAPSPTLQMPAARPVDAAEQQSRLEKQLEPSIKIPELKLLHGPEGGSTYLGRPERGAAAEEAAATSQQLAAAPDDKPANFAEQLEHALTSSARDLNMLSAEQKFKRIQGLKSLSDKLLNPPLHPTVLALTLPHVVSPLLKRFEDPVERVRDAAIDLIMKLLTSAADIEQVLQYVLPVTLERLRPAIDEKTLKKPDQPSLAPVLPPELRHTSELEQSEEVRECRRSPPFPLPISPAADATSVARAQA